MPTAYEYLNLADDELLAQCEVDCYRASGPGGQKRNKTSSAVRLRHGPTGLSAQSNEDRSQHVNKARSLRRLRKAIALAIRTPQDAQTYAPSEDLALCITDDGRIVVGRRDRRYSRAVAEVLDVLVACGARVSEAASCLEVSTAHLVKFLQGDPGLWQRVNQLRTEAGVKPLR